MEEKKIMTRWREMPWLYRIQIWAYLIAGICGAAAYPVTTKLIYSSVETDTLASRLVITSLIGIGLSVLWLQIQEKLFSWFIQFTLLEMIGYIGLVGYVIISQNFDAYLILSAIIGGTIGHIVSGAQGKLHQKITDNEQYRTDYGFFTEIVASVGVLVGSAIAVIFPIGFEVGFVLLLLSLIYAQINDIFVYVKVQKRDKNV